MGVARGRGNQERLVNIRAHPAGWITEAVPEDKGVPRIDQVDMIDLIFLLILIRKRVGDEQLDHIIGSHLLLG